MTVNSDPDWFQAPCVDHSLLCFTSLTYTGWVKLFWCSVAKLCLTLYDPYLPELAQTHVHWVDDAIQPSHPLSSPSPSAFSLSQHQGLFQWVSSSHQVAKVLELQLQLQLQGLKFISVTCFQVRGSLPPGSLCRHQVCNSEIALRERLSFNLIWFNQYLPKVSRVNAVNIVDSTKKSTESERVSFLAFNSLQYNWSQKIETAQKIISFSRMYCLFMKHI